MQGVRRAGHLFVRPRRIEDAHEHVAVDDGLQPLHEQRRGIGEAGVGLHAVGV